MSDSSGLHLLVYDRTCAKRIIGLSTAWWGGAVLYEKLDRVDASFGAASWKEALEWLATYEPSRPIAEIQYWGHGRWGRAMIDEDRLDAAALEPGHALFGSIEAIRDRLIPDEKALVWLRTCEAFGASAGHDYAQRLADTLRARVAGHTFIIGAVQSGLRALRPGCRPSWSATEGIKKGTPDEPKTAYGSSVFSPRTISCFQNEFPDAWFDADGSR